MIEAKVVNRGNCMLCGKELTEDEGIFFCKNCQDKIRNENDKRKKELEDRLNVSVQKVIGQDMQWECERCGKLIPYMADFCHECADKILEKAPNPVEPQAKSYRKFEEIVIDYPPAELCTYPEYRDKPYFSIKYEENGEHIIGFGTYKPEVLSRYIREYFIAESEDKR